LQKNYPPLTRLLTTKLTLIRPDDVDVSWPFVGRLIDSAVDNCSIPSSEYVRERALTSEAQVWVATDGEKIMGICVTRIILSGEGPILDVWFCAGTDIHKWIHHIDVIEEWGRINECVRVRSEVRPSLEPFMKQLGYTSTHVTVQKGLNN
jgi:hypothetical protein